MKQPEITIRIAGQSAEMPVQAQAEAYLARAWRRREMKGITRGEVSAYRLLWTIWAMALISAVFSATCEGAGELVMTVQSNTPGVGASTSTVSAQVTGTSPEVPVESGDRGHPALFSGIPNRFSQCSTTDSQGISRAKNGVYGFGVFGPNSTDAAATLLVTGQGTWSRWANSRPRTGSVTFTRGLWTATTDWTQSWPGTNSSNGNGTGFQGGVSYVMCPSMRSQNNAVVGQWDAWNSFQETSSSLTARFELDVPSGGLPPGRYSTKLPIYMLDSQNQGSSDSTLFVERITVISTPPACTISAPAAIDMSSSMDTATVGVGVRCEARGDKDTPPLNVGLAATASGKSKTATSDPQQLGVANSNGAMYIRGNWSSTAPTCAASDMYFDGRDGPVLGKLISGQSADFGVTPVSFRLCTTPDVKPGEYTAQATLSVVQR
ncbi:Uncharacterised protein [Cedecea lapagei]|uniref:Fimbrial protein n=1 Tax=Cedecea lapagei TaxID=158823 RepID=A0A3S4JEK6_9ENTR|nr:Uncharacterised protein [Cedecea lapagei]